MYNISETHFKVTASTSRWENGKAILLLQLLCERRIIPSWGKLIEVPKLKWNHQWTHKIDISSPPISNKFELESKVGKSMLYSLIIDELFVVVTLVGFELACPNHWLLVQVNSIQMSGQPRYASRHTTVVRPEVNITNSQIRKERRMDYIHEAGITSIVPWYGVQYWNYNG